MTQNLDELHPYEWVGENGRGAHYVTGVRGVPVDEVFTRMGVSPGSSPNHSARSMYDDDEWNDETGRVGLRAASIGDWTVVIENHTWRGTEILRQLSSNTRAWNWSYIEGKGMHVLAFAENGEVLTSFEPPCLTGLEELDSAMRQVGLIPPWPAGDGAWDDLRFDAWLDELRWPRKPLAIAQFIALVTGVSLTGELMDDAVLPAGFLDGVTFPQVPSRGEI